jgi:general secretion pathway protein A
MYLEYYGLSELPFEITPNPRFLLLAPAQREALSNLQYGIASRKGLTLLLGEAGTGKTTLIRAAMKTLGDDGAHFVTVTNPMLTRTEFAEILASGFGLSDEARRSKAALLTELEAALTARRAAGRRTALVVDEAQCLPDELLEEIRLLSNIETDSEKLLPIILAGQPELSKRLNRPSLRQVKQRVTLRCELRALGLHETAAYISGRIRQAGGNSSQLFTREAVTLVHERARGIPRLINVICDNALVTGFAADRRPVSRDLVSDVCRDFDLSGFDAEFSESSAPSTVTRALSEFASGAEPVPQEPVAAEAPRRRFRFFRVS